MKTIVTLLLTVSLFGCATGDAVKYDFSTPSPNKGLVVFSLVERGFLESTLGNDVYLLYRRIGATENRSVPDSLMSGPLYNNFVGDVDHFPGTEFGKVYVLELDPGQYEFINWGVIKSNQYATNSFKNAEPVSYRFDVTPGGIQYVGQVAVTYHSANNIIGVKMLAGGVISYENQFDRDIEVAALKYPGIDFSKIEKSIFPLETP